MRASILILLCACGRVGYPAEAELTPASLPDAGLAPDAQAQQVTTTFTPFSTPVLVPGLEGVNGDDPTLTGDMLEMIFEGSGQDLWITTRPTTSSLWGTPVALTELNSDGWESTPELDHSGLVLYFASDRSGQRAVLRSERIDRQSPWSAPEVVSEFPGEVIAVTPMSTGPALLVGVHGHDLFLSEHDGQEWSPPLLLDELNTSHNEAGGFLVSPLELWFHSAREGGLDAIYRTTRESANDAFGPPELIPELDLERDQVDPWLSPDRQTIIFTSRAASGPHFYRAERLPM
jgi:hypothetical protein